MTETGAGAGVPGSPSGTALKIVIWLVVIALALAVSVIFARAGGERSATYQPIDTPGAIQGVNRDSISLVSDSVGGLHSPVSSVSQTMIEDAEGTRIGGGDAHRETQSTALLMIPRWPFAAMVETWGWGTPADRYRLDVDMTSAASLINYENPTVARGATVSQVSGDRAGIAELFTRVLSASHLEGVYNARELAASAHVGQNWRGEGVVSIAAVLPPTASVDASGSLVVDVGGDWQVESFSVWTDDTFAYQDAVNPRSAVGVPVLGAR